VGLFGLWAAGGLNQALTGWKHLDEDLEEAWGV